MSVNAKLSEKKIKFDQTIKSHESSNGVSPAVQTGLKSRNREIRNSQKALASKTSIGSPWGVALKPVPFVRQSKAPKTEETPSIKLLPIKTKTFDNGPIKLEELKIKKSEQKRVNVIKTKVEV